MNNRLPPINKRLHKLKTGEEATPSGCSTPVFPWSPLPQKRQLNFAEHQKLWTDADEDIFYPNCDVNVWLRSCEQEIIDPIKGAVHGTIPAWLQGSLIRNGPGSLKVGNESFSHLFDSSALLHRFCIENGQVTYQCRFLQSDVYKKNRAAQRIVMTEFGTVAVPDPCQSIFQRVAAIFAPNCTQTDNAMISVYPFGDQLYAFNESPIIHRININNLSTECQVDVSNYVSVVHHTSHPHVMQDGTVYNLGMSTTAMGPYHNIVCFPNAEGGTKESIFENAHIVASIPARWPLHPSYMHTFGLTENYFIIVEQPLNLSVPAMIKGKLRNEALAGALRWYHEEYTQINVISKKTPSLVYKFYADAFFYLHIINQYETGNYIVLDICCYRDPAMLDCMYIETMKNMHKIPSYAKMFRGRPLRFVLPLECSNTFQADPTKNLIKLPNTKAKAYKLANGDIFLVPQKLCNLGCETPRIHYEKYLGKKYRYFYAISSDVDADNPGTIIKVDTETREALTWSETNCYPSEPIFVPSPNSLVEDDGVVIAAMVWGNDEVNRAGLIVLHAQTFKELGRAEFHTPGPVPKCLHGWFVQQK